MLQHPPGDINIFRPMVTPNSTRTFVCSQAIEKQLKYCLASVVTSTAKVINGSRKSIDTSLNNKSPPDHLVVAIYVPEILKQYSQHNNNWLFKIVNNSNNALQQITAWL